MKKLKYILSLSLLSAVVFSCDVQTASQDAEAYADISGDYPTPTFTLSTPANLSALNEGNEDVLVWDVVLDKPIDRATSFSFVVLDGTTATEHEDYDVVNASIPAYETTGQLMVMIHSDSDVEGAETLNLTIESGPAVASKYLVNPETTYPTANITINNYESNELSMSFDWDGGIDYGGTIYGTCANIDLDIYIADAAGFDINDPWANAYADYQAATGDCPETFTISLDEYPDGEYVLFHDLYDNGFEGLGTNTQVPVTVSFYRAGVFATQSFVQDDSQAVNSDDFGYTSDGYHNGIAAMVSIEGGIFTVTDYSGNVVASGKTSSAKSKRPEINKAPRANKGFQ